MNEVLLTNDDGYSSIGFYPLLVRLKKIFSVCPIAPTSQKSWVGKSITGHGQLDLQKTFLKDVETYTLNGTPADCVQVGLYHVLTEKPKLVISGINIGENVGHGRILSSGTVGAAMEAAIDGVKAVSSSLYVPQREREKIDFFDEKNFYIYKNAAAITVKLVSIILKLQLDPDVDLLSINIPFDATVDTEFAITKPFKEPYGKLFHKNGERLSLINPVLTFENMSDGTDLKALFEGKISITPISLDLSSKKSMKKLGEQLRKSW